jgi:hypothetical protein
MIATLITPKLWCFKKQFGTEAVIINATEGTNFEDNLVQDVLELPQCFNCQHRQKYRLTSVCIGVAIVEM